MDDIERLEIKIGFMEGQLQELNEVVVEQAKTIDLMAAQIKQLVKKVNDLIENEGEARPNRRPPHY